MKKQNITHPCHPNHPRLAAIAFAAFAVACSEAPSTPSYALEVLRPASDPLSSVGGPVAYADAARLVAGFDAGLSVVEASDGSASPGFPMWSLTSTDSGAETAVWGVAPRDGFAFFLPSGRPQVGVAELSEAGEAHESILRDALSSPFPAAIAAPEAGPGVGALFVSDAPFGPGGAVRVYPLDGFGGANPELVEDSARRVELGAFDFDGDQSEDTPIAGRLRFRGDVGLVTFTVLGNSAPGLSGGVTVFDPASGDALAQVLVPNADTSTSANGFVASADIVGDWLVVASAEKAFVPDFAELGGQLAVYRIESFDPFVVVDEDPSRPYDQPAFSLATSNDNPVGLAVLGRTVAVVNAPFFLEGTLDVFDLGETPALKSSAALGQMFTVGYMTPQDPVVSAGEDRLLLATEAGLIEIGAEPVE